MIAVVHGVWTELEAASVRHALKEGIDNKHSQSEANCLEMLLP